jgi:hypothetical protein
VVIWSGKGFLAAVIVFGCSLAMEWFTETATKNDNYYQASSSALPLALVLGGAITSGIALALPREDRNRDTLFFILMIWWGPILAVIASFTFAYRIVALE